MWEFAVTTDYFMEMLTNNNSRLGIILFKHNLHHVAKISCMTESWCYRLNALRKIKEGAVF